jgi:ankyrin repeat protein
VNWRDSIGETALLGAAALGHAEVVRFLLGVGADCNIAESAGYTPLHWATSHGNLETVAGDHLRERSRGPSNRLSAALAGLVRINGACMRRAQPSR